MHAAMHEAGFVETHLLHFPQVIYPSGWWSGSIACKQAGALNARLDDKAIAQLDCKFYNADTHPGAFALPTYVRQAPAPRCSVSAPALLRTSTPALPAIYTVFVPRKGTSDG